MPEQKFNHLIQNLPVDLPRAALTLAREIAYPGLEVSHYLHILDKFAEIVASQTPHNAPTAEKLSFLSGFLFNEVGLRGNQQDYEDPRNSYLNDVIDRGYGIPISLSVIYIGVAQRLGLNAFGAALPGHFIVGVSTGQHDLYLDPFHAGRLLTLADCRQLVESSTGNAGPFQMDWLEPAPQKVILARMLNNLRNIYFTRNQWQPAMAVVERLRMIEPHAPQHMRDLGLLNLQAGSLGKGVELLEYYLSKNQGSRDHDTLQRHLKLAAQELARLN